MAPLQLTILGNDWTLADEYAGLARYMQPGGDAQVFAGPLPLLEERLQLRARLQLAGVPVGQVLGVGRLPQGGYAMVRADRVAELLPLRLEAMPADEAPSALLSGDPDAPAPTPALPQPWAAVLARLCRGLAQASSLADILPSVPIPAGLSADDAALLAALPRVPVWAGPEALLELLPHWGLSGMLPLHAGPLHLVAASLLGDDAWVGRHLLSSEMRTDAAAVVRVCLPPLPAEAWQAVLRLRRLQVQG